MAEPPIPFLFETGKKYLAARNLKIVLSRPTPSTAEWDTRDPDVRSILKGTLMEFDGQRKGGWFLFTPERIESGQGGSMVTG